MPLYRTIASYFPEMKMTLLRARMEDTVEHYIKKVWMTNLYLSGAILLIIFMFTKSFLALLFYPLVFVIMFFYVLQSATQKARKLDFEISKEIVFAGRFMIIELESGIPLYSTFKNVGGNYQYVGHYFNNIVDKVQLGTGIDDAINETIDLCPSENLKRILYQILNAMKTGADLSKALNSVIENIVREQNIAVKEFSNKLNPLAMFYMMIAIIVPSLGVTMLIVLASFMQLEFNLTIFLSIAFFIGFIQLMFLMIIKNSRPHVDM